MIGTTVDGLSSHRRSAILLVLAGVQLLVLSSVWPGFLSPNEASRVLAARAFVHSGSFAIDHELARWGMIDDVSVHGGRHYSNKAPGLIWAAVPVVAVVEAVDPGVSLEMEQYLCRVVLVSAVALAAAWLLGGWTRRLGSDGDLALFIALFASVFAVYAGTFFSHSWSGGLLLAAAWLLLGPGRRFGSRGETAAGFLIAMAAVSEYPAAVLGATLAVAAAWGDWRRALRLAAGGFVPLAGLALYNYACFGSALTLSSRMEALPRYRHLAAQTFFGFSLPQPAGLAGLLISPLLGLFFFFPVLLPALLSPVAAWRRGYRRIAVVLGAAVWVLPLLMSAYKEWAGGASFGPRYLVLALPFSVLGLGFLEGRATRWWIGGAILPSALLGLAGRLVPPFAIDDVWTASTIRGWVLPALRHGLWNGPPGVAGVASDLLAMATVTLLWLAALAVVFARPHHAPTDRQRAAALLLTVALLALQLTAGSVTDRQRAWFRYVTPAFAVSRPARPAPTTASPLTNEQRPGRR